MSRFSVGPHLVTPAPSADGWIPWAGGKCPVDPDTLVAVRTVGAGEYGFDRADTVEWSANRMSGMAVVAYRVQGPADIVRPEHPMGVPMNVTRGLEPGNTDAAGEGKQTNPKDSIGSTKLHVGLVPDSLVTAAAMAFTEGAAKYGRYNWRIAGVRASIYHDALRRHLAKWWNGEDVDRQTGVPHLASVAACAAILIDADLLGKLTDDRPPSAPETDDITAAEVVATGVKQLFAKHNPKQWTINDVGGA